MNTAWTEKTVKRYYWNGKGYHSKTAVCRAIAKKEAIIWCATYVADHLGRTLPKVIAAYSTGGTRRDVSWVIALAFANLGYNGDKFFCGLSVFAVDSPWQVWINRRVNHLLLGDAPMIEKTKGDYGYEWSFREPKLAIVHGLPFADEIVNGESPTKDVVESLRRLWGEYEERYPNMSGYERFNLLSPLDLLQNILDQGAEAQAMQELARQEIDW